MSRTICVLGIFTLGLGLALALLLLLANPSQGVQAGAIQTSLVVNTLEDEEVADGDCSLREAILAANDNLPVDACLSGDGVMTDTITFGVAGTISLTSELSLTVGGPLVIDGGQVITVSGADSVRALYLYTSTSVIVENLTIADGGADLDPSGCILNYGSLTIINSIFSGNQSGGILNLGSLTITNSIFSGNHAEDGGGLSNAAGTVTIISSTISGNIAGVHGGGISNDGTLTITDSILSGNNSDNSGGAMINRGTLTVTNSTLAGNHSTIYGGGIYNRGTATVINSTVSGNSAYAGGGIYNSDSLTQNTLTVSNSTLAGNSAEYGGGIYNLSTTILTNNTLSGNSATFYGGIFNSGTLSINASTLFENSANSSGGGIFNLPGNDSASMHNSILANSPSGGNCAGGPIIDAGYNLEDTDTCGFDPVRGSLPNTDPLLFILQDNGGPTLTHAMQIGSPAIDAGDPLGCLPADQRGLPRPFDGDGDGDAACDIGAYEADPPFPSTTLITSVEPEPSRAGGTLTVTFEASSTLGIPFGMITVTVDGDSENCSATLAGGVGSCALALSSPGAYTLTATYGGSAFFLPSSADQTHLVVENYTPVAAYDAYTTAEDTPLGLPAPGVLLNDSDLNGDSLTALIDSQPLTGTLVLSSDGSFVYTPTLNFHGLVTFTYEASDGLVGSNSAMVTITVSSINDPPLANDHAFSVLENSSDNSLDVLAGDTDADGDQLVIAAVGSPDQDGAALNAASLILYTPAPGFSGTETFAYSITDGNGGLATGLVTVVVTLKAYPLFVPILLR